MQVVAAAAMEPPVPRRPDDDQGRAGRAVPRGRGRPTRRTTCAGSTTATATIDGVAADSTTETYAALRLEIENWRWSGVPFFIRTGKRLPGDPDRAPARVQAAAAARASGFDRRAGAEPARRQARPVDRDPARSSRRAARTPRAPPGSTSTWSSPTRAARAPTPYEVLLHAAMVGDSTRFTRQDGVEETWRIMQPLLDAPPPVHPYAPGLVGPRGRPTSSSPVTAAGTGRGSRHERRETSAAAAAPQSAAAPSPFPPIADYAFLSNCHTGALVAPDGAIDWLCVPAFDSPSVFGSLLDREAGFFRLGPFGINHPSARHYEPGTNVLVTTWKTPMGWIVVRDALTMGPYAGDGLGHAAHAAAGRRRRRPHARADGRVHRGPGRDRARLRARVRLRPDARRMDAGRRRRSTPPTRPAPGRRSASSPISRSGSRATASAAVTCSRRASARTAALSWAEGFAAPRDVDEAEERMAATTRFWRAWLGARPDPRPPLARPDPALGAHDQGPHVHADRRDRGGAHDVAARDARAASATGTTATRGCATRRSRSRRCTGSTSTGRPTSSCSSSPTSRRTRTARCRSCTGSTAAAT